MPNLSADLLDQDRLLARREPKRPRQASLRRSISASYYSLFHFLIEEVTVLVIGTGQSKAELRHFAGRAFIHTKMKTLCVEFTKSTPSSDLLKTFWESRGVAESTELQMVAGAFRDLQELRHDADYNLALSFTRLSALDAADLLMRPAKRGIVSKPTSRLLRNFSRLPCCCGRAWARVDPAPELARMR